MSNITSFVKRIRDIMRNDPGINGDAQRIEQIAWMLFLKVYDAKEQDWDIDEDNYESIIPENCRWANWAVDDHSGSAMTGDRLLNFVNNTLFPTLKELNVTPETPIKKSIVKTTFEDTNNYMKDGVLLRQVINVIDELDLGDYEESHAFGEIYESILKELQSAGSAGEFYTPSGPAELLCRLACLGLTDVKDAADPTCGSGSLLLRLKNYANVRNYHGQELTSTTYNLARMNMILRGIPYRNFNIYNGDTLEHDYFGDMKFRVQVANPPYSANWSADMHFMEDERFNEYGKLAPKSKADFAFVSTWFTTWMRTGEPSFFCRMASCSVVLLRK